MSDYFDNVVNTAFKEADIPNADPQTRIDAIEKRAGKMWRTIEALTNEWIRKIRKNDPL